MRRKIRSIPVRDVKQLLVAEPATVQEEDPMELVMSKMLQDPTTRSVYVLDGESRVVGSIRLSAVVEYIFPYDKFWKADDYADFWSVLFRDSASEFMVRDFRFVYDDTPIADMVDIVIREGLEELPVVDHDMKILGEVNIMEVIAYFNTHADGIDLTAPK